MQYFDSWECESVSKHQLFFIIVLSILLTYQFLQVFTQFIKVDLVAVEKPYFLEYEAGLFFNLGGKWEGIYGGIWYFVLQFQERSEREGNMCC